jgi:hypothetical protein
MGVVFRVQLQGGVSMVISDKYENSRQIVNFNSGKCGKGVLSANGMDGREAKSAAGFGVQDREALGLCGQRCTSSGNP